MRTINPIQFALAALEKSAAESKAYLGNGNSAFMREIDNDIKLVKFRTRNGFKPVDSKCNDQHNLEVTFESNESNVTEEFSNRESVSAISAFCEAYELAERLAVIC